MNRNLGWLLYVGGVCVAAFGGTRIPVWWPVLVAGVVLVVAGTVLIRKAGASGGERDEGADETERPVARLAQLQALAEGVSGLHGDATSGQADLGSIQQTIETLQADQALPFADGRGILIERHGMAAFAEVMSPFAVGERYLNRAWSCAVDEHAPECHAALGVAAKAFENATAAWQALG